MKQDFTGFVKAKVYAEAKDASTRAVTKALQNGELEGTFIFDEWVLNPDVEVNKAWTPPAPRRFAKRTDGRKKVTMWMTDEEYSVLMKKLADLFPELYKANKTVA